MTLENKLIQLKLPPQFLGDPVGERGKWGVKLTTALHSVRWCRRSFNKKEKFEQKRKFKVQCLWFLSLHRGLPGQLSVQSGGEIVRTMHQNDQQGPLVKSYYWLFSSPALFPSRKNKSNFLSLRAQKTIDHCWGGCVKRENESKREREREREREKKPFCQIRV